MGAKISPVADSDVQPFDEAAVDVIEIVGTIKWFDAGKGYGFVVPDSGQPDVLLHVTCLRRDGYETAYEGARIVCEALDRPRGLQAFRILSMDESTAVHPSQLLPTVRSRCRHLRLEALPTDLPRQLAHLPQLRGQVGVKALQALVGSLHLF